MAYSICNNWTPERVCTAPLKTAEEKRDGCCRRCAREIEVALARNLRALAE